MPSPVATEQPLVVCIVFSLWYVRDSEVDGAVYYQLAS
jgi:hypothetical protein